jgi:hypothetical protein
MYASVNKQLIIFKIASALLSIAKVLWKVTLCSLGLIVADVPKDHGVFFFLVRQELLTPEYEGSTIL